MTRDIVNAITVGWDNDSGTSQWAVQGPVALIWTDELGNSILDERGAAVDAQFAPGLGFGGGSQLLTAVLISLFSDSVASPDDSIPDGSADPRGWWAGAIGSKLWLRARSKATPDMPALIKRDVEAALQWMVDDDVVAAIGATVGYQRPGMIGCEVVLKRHDGVRGAIRFAKLWES